MNTKAIEYLKTLKGKKIALIGLGRSHLPLISLFTKYGAIVYGCDKRDRDNLNDIATNAENEGAILSLGKNYLESIDVDMALRTPGMKYYCDELNNLRDKDVEITSEMELFFKLCNCKIIGITGSDGKTTTTTIINEILKKDGYTVHLGGNIGKPLLPEIESIDEEDIAVVELSSFQLISMDISPDISVVTNLAENHLDIHKDMQEYIDSKKNIVKYQHENDRCVLNLDNELTNAFENDTKARVYKFSKYKEVNRGSFLKNGYIYYKDNEEIKKIININNIRIAGMHNVENFMTAIAAVYDIVDVNSIIYTAEHFAGVEHRSEFVREINGIKFFNDSIASSPTRTALGTLSLYDFKIILIAGGYDKNLDYTSLGELICSKVKVLILMGDTADKIENATKASHDFYKSDIKIIRVTNMEEAVKKAYENAETGDIISLSPASASFDLYKDFEERGRHFKSIVNNL